MESRWRRAARPAVALALVPALLAGSIVVGLRVPGVTYPHSALPAALDYSRGAVPGVTGLRSGFIERVLGSAVGFDPGTGFFRGSESPSRIREILDREPAPAVVTHELVNDDFEDAYRVGRLPFGARTDTTTASSEPGEPSDCARVGDKTVWYRLDMPVDAGLIADTFGTDHAVDLRVFEGQDRDELTTIGCGSSPKGNAHVPFSGKAGSRYYFQISAISGGSLSFNVRLQGATQQLAGVEGYGGVLMGGSADGRHWAVTAFLDTKGSSSACLSARAGVGLDQSCSIQAFVVDVETERLTQVSLTPAGRLANGISVATTVSAGGRHVAFYSTASDLVEDDTNTCYIFQEPGRCIDVFVRDRDTDDDGLFDEPGAVRTVRVSVSTEGRQGNGWSAGMISDDGRFVGFQSEASNLVPGDSNGVGDAFLHDRDADRDGIFDEQHVGARRTTMLSVSPTGEPADAGSTGTQDVEQVAGRRDYVPLERGSHLLGISRTGRYAVFRSRASNLVAGDDNGVYDVFLRDAVAGHTTRVNVSSSEREANRGTRLHNSFARPVSEDGRYVLFNSDATNLVNGDNNESEDLFIRDVREGTTERLTVDRNGGEVSEPAAPGRDVVWGGFVTLMALLIFEGDIFTLSELNHAMSSNGRYVYFSSAGQLVPEDEDEHRDLYVRDMRRGTLSLVSVSTTGEKGNASSNQAWPSLDGRVVGFGSTATNLDDRRRDGSPTAGVVWTSYLRFLPPEP